MAKWINKLLNSQSEYCAAVRMNELYTSLCNNKDGSYQAKDVTQNNT